MTTIALLADIHGNLPAQKAVLDELQQIKPQAILVAGDLTGGPQFNETTQLLREAGAWMILGNSDLNLLRLADGSAPATWYSSQQFALLRWTHQVATMETLQFLRSLTEQDIYAHPGCAPIRVVHGSPRSPYESILPDHDMGLLEMCLELIDEPVLVCGHTHQPWAIRVNGKLAVNPGAVCSPLNGVTGADYALLHWKGDRWQAELRLASYNLGKIRRAFEQSGLLSQGGPLALSFLLSIENGRDVALQFLTYAYQLAEQAGVSKGSSVPDDVWQQAGETFDWRLAEKGGYAEDLNYIQKG